MTHPGAACLRSPSRGTVPASAGIALGAALACAPSAGAALITVGGLELFGRIVTNTGSGTSTQVSNAYSWSSAISTGTPQQGANGPVSLYATFTQTAASTATTQDLSLRFHGTITHSRGTSGTNNRTSESYSSQWLTFSVPVQVTYALTALQNSVMVSPSAARTLFGVEQSGVATPVLASTEATATGTRWSATLQAGTYRFWNQTLIAGLPATGDGSALATGSWSFHADSAPAPGAIALLGLAGAVHRRRRERGSRSSRNP